ncbi:MAG: trehalose-6-phosphate synthase [Candidatus Kerfeldbacteria bacterium]|nr:trehalose-6-phosphate synthase [Candidatus Kerfeldbacteria bacterium]
MRRGPDVVHVTRSKFVKPEGEGFAVGRGGVETAMAGAVPGPDVEVALDVQAGVNPQEVRWMRTEVDKRKVRGLETHRDDEFAEPISHVILEQMLKASEFEDFRRMSILWWWVHHRNPENLRVDATKNDFRRYFDRYNQVSYGIAEKMHQEGLLRPDVPVLIHDAYYFPRVPQGIALMNRNRGRSRLPPIDAHLVGINHIPFPSVEDFQMIEGLDIPGFQVVDSQGMTLARKVVMHYLAGWAGLNTISFHTDKDARNFESAVEYYLSGRKIGIPELLVNPLGINIEHVETVLERVSPADRERVVGLLRDSGLELPTLRDKTVFVDIGTRADPIKRIPLKFQGFAELLSQRPDLRGKVQLIQQIRQHRQEYPSYRREYEEVVALRDRINARYDNDTIVLVDQALDNTDVLLMYRMLAESAGRFSGCFTGYEGMCLSAQECAISAADFHPGLIVTEEAGVGNTMRMRGINRDFIIPQHPTPADVARAMSAMHDAPVNQIADSARDIRRMIEDIQLPHWKDRVMAAAFKKKP